MSQSSFLAVIEHRLIPARIRAVSMGLKSFWRCFCLGYCLSGRRLLVVMLGLVWLAYGVLPLLFPLCVLLVF